MREGIESIIQRLRDLRTPDAVIATHVAAVEAWRTTHKPKVKRMYLDYEAEERL
jgi:hypothetical protein